MEMTSRDGRVWDETWHSTPSRVLLNYPGACWTCIVPSDPQCLDRGCPPVLGLVGPVHRNRYPPPAKVESAAWFGSSVHPEMLKMVIVKQNQLCPFPISDLFRFTLCLLSSLLSAGRGVRMQCAWVRGRACAHTHTHTFSLSLPLPPLSLELISPWRGNVSSFPKRNHKQAKLQEPRLQ